MASDQPHWEKLIAYFANHLSAEEKSSIEQWRDASEKNRGHFNDAQKIWESTGVKVQLRDDETDEQWSVLRSKMEARSFSLSGMWVKIAAAVMVLALLTYAFKKLTDPGEVTISSGDQVATIYLPDSSVVWLNAHSTFSYPENYLKGNRKTKLNGEGYFQVRRDTANPFLIKVREATVQVVGTSFNVKESEAEVDVVVNEGVVKITLTGSKDETSIVVKRDERATLKNYQLTRTANQDEAYAAWRLVNNPTYEKEKVNPLTYLKANFSWHKNQSSQSVIDVQLQNTAALADYQNISLLVTYSDANRKTNSVRVTISDTVRAGETISFRKRLIDVLPDAQHLQVEVETANTVK